MNHVNGDGAPNGYVTGTYRAGRTINIQAVHPYTKCFEGPYCDITGAQQRWLCPTETAESCEDATESVPFIFNK